MLKNRSKERIKKTLEQYKVKLVLMTYFTAEVQNVQIIVKANGVLPEFLKTLNIGCCCHTNILIL